MMKPTLQDIADYAGVSRGTVDRVLHNRPKVSAENRRKVESALRKLNYTPNPAARSLALSVKKLTIGVLVAPWPSFYHNEIMRGIDGAKNDLRDYGLNVLVQQYAVDRSEECIKAIDAMLAEGVRGIAIRARNSAPVREKLLSLSRQGIPVVTFNSDIPGCGRICFVGQDEVTSGRIAADLMLKLMGGRGKILVMCGNPEFVGLKNRFDGFMAKLNECGVATTARGLVNCCEEHEVTYAEVLDHLRTEPDTTGVYLAIDGVSAVVTAIRDAKLGHKVRLVCHDVVTATRDYLREGAVDFTLDQNFYRQGAMPVSILASYILGGKKPEREMVFSSAQIVGPENLPA